MENQIMEKRFGGSQLGPEYAGYRRSKIVILQCPYDATASYIKGTKKGPEAIIKASGYMELYDDELDMETFKGGIYTKPPLKLEGVSPEDMVKKVRSETLSIIKAGKIPVILGGEHSVSIGAVNALSGAYRDLSVLHLDAHHDLKDEYEGSKYSHACVTRRFLEACPVTQVGTRSLSKDEQEFVSLGPKGLKTINVYDILDEPMWKKKALKSLKENVYISLDMDVFDVSLMPAVGTPEPGGIGWYELLDLLKIVAMNKNVVGFDAVELCPIEGMVAPDFLAAKLIYRLIGYILSGGNKR